MKKDGRTGYAIIHYARKGDAHNADDYRVYIQRWGSIRPLHNAWVDWKMNRNRVLRPGPPLGEDFFWTIDGMLQNLAFQRGLFHVVIEAGSASAYEPMLRLAEVIDAKIRGKPIPKPEKRQDSTN
jgi:hypothetical protein